MNNSIDDLFQKIGNCVLDIVADDSPKIVVYVEVEPGVVSVSIFCSPADGG